MKRLPRLRVLACVLAVAFAAAAPLAHAGSYEDFFTAVKRDDSAAISELLQRGFDPNSLDPQGRTALMMALQDESLRVAEALIAAPSTNIDMENAVGETPLMMAALHGREALCRKLLARGARVNKSGWTPLHYAATGPSTPIVTLLIERGAAVNAESPNRTTPLMMAARYGMETSVDVLLAHGADLRRTNDRQLSAVDFARLGGREPLTRRLLALVK